ncbi:unnamed protein product [Amoebophrya sp. A25]|nr:unnamed protein product [Amoebophrya sp. A25]|eukprot:GSA25T00004193001.1
MKPTPTKTGRHSSVQPKPDHAVTEKKNIAEKKSPKDSAPTFFMDLGAWHLRLGTTTTDACGASCNISGKKNPTDGAQTKARIGPNQLGLIESHPHNLFCWEPLQSFLDAQLGVRLFFPKRADVYEDLRLQRHIMQSALAEYARNGKHISSTSRVIVAVPACSGEFFLIGDSSADSMSGNPSTHHATSGRGTAEISASPSASVSVSSSQAGGSSSSNSPTAHKKNADGTSTPDIRLQRNPLSSKTLLRRAAMINYSAVEKLGDKMFTDGPFSRYAVVPDLLMAAWDPMLDRVHELGETEDTEEYKEKPSGTTSPNLTARARGSGTTNIIVDLGFGSARVGVVIDGKWCPKSSVRAFHLGGYCLTRLLQEHLKLRHGESTISNFFYNVEIWKQRCARCHFSDDEEAGTPRGDEDEGDDKEEEGRLNRAESLPRTATTKRRKLAPQRFEWSTSTYDFSQDPETLRDIRERKNGSHYRVLKEWACYQLGEFIFRPRQVARHKTRTVGGLPTATGTSSAAANDSPADRVVSSSSNEAMCLPTLSELVGSVAKKAGMKGSASPSSSNCINAISSSCKGKRNIIVVGGGARIMGIRERLEAELSEQHLLGGSSAGSSYKVLLGDELSIFRGMHAFAKENGEQIPWIETTTATSSST